MRTLVIAAACVVISAPAFAQAAMSAAPTWMPMNRTAAAPAQAKAPANHTAQRAGTMHVRKATTSEVASNRAR